MEMEASSSPYASLRDRLRATVCCCFGAGAAERTMRWRRRAGVGEFRYDPLSYALNFDDQLEEENDDDAGDHVNGGFLYRSFSSRLPPSPPPPARARPRAAAAAAEAAVAVA